LQTIELVVK